MKERLRESLTGRLMPLSWQWHPQRVEPRSFHSFASPASPLHAAPSQYSTCRPGTQVQIISQARVQPIGKQLMTMPKAPSRDQKSDQVALGAEDM
jgi:hypothetical protein